MLSHAGIRRDLDLGMAPQSVGRNRSSQELLICVLLFSISAAHIEIDLIGKLYFTDLLMLAISPFAIIIGRHMLVRPLPRKFIVLSCAWLGAQIVTDFIRETAFRDYARGWSKIGLTIIEVCALYVLVGKRPKRFLAYGAGMAVGIIVNYIQAPTLQQQYDPWKFVFGYPVTLAVILISTSLFERQTYSALCVGIIGAVNIYFSSRALGGVCLVAAGYVIIQEKLWKIAITERRRQTIAIVAPIILAVLAFFTVQSYALAAQSGYMGQAAKYRYRSQSSGLLGTIIGGRGEILASARAVWDSPFLGHGSWARDPKYYAIYVSTMQRLGYEEFTPEYEDAPGLIQTHSYFFGAWVEAGILGAVFWIWVISTDLATLVNLAAWHGPRSILIAFCAFMLLWDVMFSPFGAATRFTAPFHLLAIMFVREGIMRAESVARGRLPMHSISWHIASPKVELVKP